MCFDLLGQAATAHSLGQGVLSVVPELGYFRHCLICEGFVLQQCRLDKLADGYLDSTSCSSQVLLRCGAAEEVALQASQE